jgi:hypothetical protein
VAGIDCVCCYREDCAREPNCMDLVRAEAVFEAVVRELAAVGGRPAGEASESPCDTHSLVGEPGR